MKREIGGTGHSEEEAESQNIKRASVKKFAQAAFAQGSTIYSDGYGSYIPALEGYT